MAKDSSKDEPRKRRPPKRPLHSILTDRGWAEDRDQAERVIRAGSVRVDDELVDKPGTQVRPDSRIEILRKKHPFVSRGGRKLEAALNAFDLQVDGLRCLDVGIGTGGFSDCLLQRGAAHVTGVDVGYGDVAWKLRQDPRVRLFERTNFRAMDVTELAPPFDLVVVDCSFISLELLMENLDLCVADDGSLLTLIKPQFEARPDQVGDRGLVDDPELREEIRLRMEGIAQKRGFHAQRRLLSPVPGARSGNKEWLVLFGRSTASS